MGTPKYHFVMDIFVAEYAYPSQSLVEFGKNSSVTFRYQSRKVYMARDRKLVGNVSVLGRERFFNKYNPVLQERRTCKQSKLLDFWHLTVR